MSCGLTHAITAWGSKTLKASLNQAKADLAAVVASRELGKSKVAVAEAALRSAEAQSKNSDTTLTRAAILAKERIRNPGRT